MALRILDLTDDGMRAAGQRGQREAEEGGSHRLPLFCRTQALCVWRDLQTDAVAWRIWSDSVLGNASWVSDLAGPT